MPKVQPPAQKQPSKRKPERLDDEIKRVLEARRGDLKVIAAGSGVSHSWISKFINDKIPKPSYDMLQKLKDYFSQAPRAGRPPA